MGKVLNEYTDDTNSAKEHMYCREVGIGTPVNNFVDPSQVWDAVFGCANMAYYSDLASAQKQLFAQEGFPTAFHMLDDVVEVSKMFPDKVVDATVLQDHLKGAVLALVHSRGATDGHVIYVENGELGTLWLKDMCDVIVEYWNSIGPTHG